MSPGLLWNGRVLRQRRNFSREIKLEAATLVREQSWPSDAIGNGQPRRRSRSHSGLVNSWQSRHQDVGFSPSSLDGAEGMFDRLTALAHLLRMLAEPALHRLENVLMFPSGDPSLLVGGAAVCVGLALADRTNVDVLLSHVAESLLAEAPCRLGVRGHHLRQRDRDIVSTPASISSRLKLPRLATSSRLVASSFAFVSLATCASCDRSVPTWVTSWVTIK